MWEQSDRLLHQNMKLCSELTDASYFGTDTVLSEVPRLRYTLWMCTGTNYQVTFARKTGVNFQPLWCLCVHTYLRM